MGHFFDSPVTVAYFGLIAVLFWSLPTTGAVFLTLLFLSRGNPDLRMRVRRLIRASGPLVALTMVSTSCLLIPLTYPFGIAAIVLICGLLIAAGIVLTGTKKEET
jgi:hypothetical protein